MLIIIGSFFFIIGIILIYLCRKEDRVYLFYFSLVLFIGGLFIGLGIAIEQYENFILQYLQV